mmetsp:Transcript_25739/g.64880  ORF Transcript_25739/g.64880 Transcript_25739/m.64880 type:complete len:120 (-) Transcript_25739:136-495(-)
MENRLRRYCGEHKRKTDVDLSATLCAHPGCTGYAVFGLVRGKVVMCGAHRLLGMTDVKNTRCGHADGCHKRPCSDQAGNPSRFCKLHVGRQCGVVRKQVPDSLMGVERAHGKQAPEVLW